MEKSLKKCFDDALRLLTRKEYSVLNLKKKLILKGHTAGDVDAVCQELQNLRYLDEENYFQARTRGLLRKNYAPKLIHYRLQQEGLTISLEEFLMKYQELIVAELPDLRARLERRFFSPESHDHDCPHGRHEDQKALSYLMRKGHSYGESLAICARNSLRETDERDW